MKKNRNQKTMDLVYVGQAKRLNKEIRIESWVTDKCHLGNSKCTRDIAIRYVKSDGTIHIKYKCTTII